jgi:hypothetical protein
MHDLAGELWSRKLSDIVIPGSHDTGTYALPNDPISLIGKAQSEDITSQLNDGARAFDIRVKWSEGNGTLNDPCYSADFYAQHGILTACSLNLSDIFTQIDNWANQPGHEQEIILVGLSIDLNGATGNYADVLRPDCEALGKALGSALLTPGQLEAAGYSADPGQVTLGQLWAMPGHPRVLVTNELCMDLAEGAATGTFPENPPTWNPDPPFGSGAGQSMYANQCYADVYAELLPDGSYMYFDGVKSVLFPAAKTRAYQGGGDNFYPGDAEISGPPMKGGIWTLFIQSTPTWGCLWSLKDFSLASEDKVLATLYHDWWQNIPQVHDNINIISGDFVQQSDIVTDALAMDETYPMVPGAITPVGPQKVVQSSNVPATDFAARVTDYTGAAMAGAQVTYQVSPAAFDSGVGWGLMKRDKTRTVTADAEGDVNPGDALYLPGPGTWTVTASAGGVTATWTVDIVPPTGSHLVAQTCPCSGEVGRPYLVQVDGLEASFAVEVDDANGFREDGIPVTFDAGSRGVFVNGNSDSGTDKEFTGGLSSFGGPNARAPEFIPGAYAGTFLISVSAPGVDNTLSLQFTATAGPAVRFVETQGDDQSTPIGTKFPIALKGYWADQYGNRAPPPSGADELTLDPASGATWPNGQKSVKFTVGADGTITAPDLTAGNTVSNNRPNDVLRVMISSGASGVSYATGWQVEVTPGPAAKVATISGDSQRTAARKPFAHALAVKVTDARGHPVAGAPVIFKVTSGKAAAFAPANLQLAAAVSGHRALLQLANPPRRAVTVPTNDQGVATAPALTAGPKAGPITVTASVGVSGNVKAVFHSSVVS